MELRTLRLDGFRNYADLELGLGAGMHIFAGANAQGKTNLLEAVYLAATGRSPRTGQESELIAWDREVARVIAEFVSDQRGAFSVEVSLGRKSSGTGSEARRGGAAEKRIKVNGAQRSAADLAGLTPVVLFLVDDLEIIRGEPARRRDFLDTDLSAMSRTYQWAWRQYNRILDQRNRLLKDIRDGQGAASDLPPWDAQLAAFGGRLLEVRLRFVADLNAQTVPVYRGLSASAQEMTVAYRREWGDPEANPTARDALAALLADAIDESVEEEIRRGSTLIGPHRDDLQILVGGKDIRFFGSQGEQRTAAVALRVAECAMLRQLVDEWPVLLLDDIFSELDRTRRGALLGYLTPLTQVILTTTDVDAIGLPPETAVKIYQVSGGTVAQP
ncbi:MAG: DNA replication/repair protein RecF [Armatimonadota bacterium]